MSQERASRFYNILLLELQLQKAFRSTGPLFADEAQVGEAAIDMLVRRAEKEYQQAGRPPMDEREQCIALLEQNYIVN